MYKYIIISFALNIISCLFFLKLKIFRVRLNFYIVFYGFSLVFLAISPLIQYLSKIKSFFGGRDVVESEILELNFIVFLIQLFFYFFYHLLEIKRFKLSTNSFPSKYSLFSLFLISTFIVFVIRWHTLEKFFLTYQDNVYLLTNLNVHLRYFYIVVQSIIVYLAVSFFFLNYKYFYFIIIAFTVIFPLSLPRFTIAIFILPLFIIFIEKRSKYANLFFLIGIPFIFNFFNQFRYGIQSVYFSDLIAAFNQAHYDNFYNFLIIINDLPITYGKQVLGNLLFFIPREYFESKSLGSGPYFSKLANFNYTNVSCNFFAEGYLNFGYLGIGLYVVILAFASKALDSLIIETKINRYFFLTFCFLFYFTLRGDFLTGYYYSTINFIAIMSVNLFSRFYSKKL